MPNARVIKLFCVKNILNERIDEKVFQCFRSYWKIREKNDKGFGHAKRLEKRKISKSAYEEVCKEIYPVYRLQNGELIQQITIWKKKA